MTRRSGGRWRLITAEQDDYLLPSSSNTTASIAAIVNSSNFLELPMAVYTYLCNILMPTSLSPAEAVLQKCPSIKPVRPAPPPREQARLTLTQYCAAAQTEGLCLYLSLFSPSSSPDSGRGPLLGAWAAVESCLPLWPFCGGGAALLQQAILFC